MSPKNWKKKLAMLNAKRGGIIRTVQVKEDLRKWVEFQSIENDIQVLERKDVKVPEEGKNFAGILQRIALFFGILPQKLMNKLFIKILKKMHSKAGNKYLPTLKKEIGKLSAKEPRLNIEHIFVIRERTPNAFIALDSVMGVTTGFCRAFINDPSVLRFVLAHEISHGASKAGQQQLGFGLMTFIGSIIGVAGIVTVWRRYKKPETPDDLDKFVGALAAFILSRVASPVIESYFSRVHERQADAMAVDLMLKTYGPKVDMNGPFYFFDYLVSKYKLDKEGIIGRIVASHPQPKKRAIDIYSRLVSKGYPVETIRDYKLLPQEERLKLLPSK